MSIFTSVIYSFMKFLLQFQIRHVITALDSETHSANENAVVKSLKVSKPIDTNSVFRELQLLLDRESELLNRKSMHYTDFIICIQNIFPKKIELFDTITDPDLTVRGFFHPVMEDLISNVLQRSSSKPKIYLSQYRGGLHFRIEETGKGMTPNELKMFGNLLEQRTTGDTLGTFTSISILRSAGYQICVKSVSGEGTSIDIYENGELEKLVFKSKYTKIFA